MLLELHCHTHHYSSCSLVEPKTLVSQAVLRGLQGVVITEHRHLWSEDELVRLRQETEVDESFVLLSAQEVETDIGHVLLFGADVSVPDRIEVAALRKRFPNAALVWAHPFRYGRIPDAAALLAPCLDGIEIFSQNHTPKENYRGMLAWHQLKFTAISGSDTHSRAMAATFPTLFDHPVSTIQEVADEIKSGRCRPLYKEIPAAGSNIVVTRITIGTKGIDESRSNIVIKNVKNGNKWRQMKRTVNLITRLHKAGFSRGAYRVPGIIDVNDEAQVLIEESQRGKTLFELVKSVSEGIGQTYFRMAGQWLARLHSLKMRVGHTGRTIRKEQSRFESYLRSFEDTSNPRTGEVRKIIERVRIGEERLFEHDRQRFIQNHGDFHPKNIIIGQDLQHDISTLYVSVIDFDSSFTFVPAFDVGYFISQFMYQFHSYPTVLQRYRRDDFIEAYRSMTASLAASKVLQRYLVRSEKYEKAFDREVTLFELRANMSIASYLIKMGKGESDDMEWLMNRSLDLLDRLEAM